MAPLTPILWVALACQLDPDGDGLDEAAERDLAPLGADPARPDVFVEADWEECDPIVAWCGPDHDRDQNRMSARVARELAVYFAPDVSVHVDRGQLGGAGGATRLPAGTHHCAPDAMAPERYGRFHHAIVTAAGSGGTADLFGFCFAGDVTAPGVLAQELGHNLGLDHGGFGPAQANCKPHYRSPMNYAYSYDRRVTRLSRGELAGVVLDPTSLDELRGLGTTDPAVLEALRGEPFSFLVRDDGAIDWNRDGQFEERVRGAPTWAWASCEQSWVHRDEIGPAVDPTLAVWPAPGEGLALVARRVEDGRLEIRTTGPIPPPEICDPSGMAPVRCTAWTPALDQPARPVEGSLPGVGAPGLATFAGELHLVYRDASMRLVHQRSADAVRWTAPSVIDPYAFVDGDVTLVATERGVSAYAPSAGMLAAWAWDASADAWEGPWIERWSDGTWIEPAAGVAVARGHQVDVAGEGLYAAIPLVPYGRIAFARRDEATGLWRRLPDEQSPVAPAYAATRPGLAYVPFDPLVPSEGRFYLAWKPFPAGAIVIAMTEGNDPSPGATSRRLRFWRPAYFANVWALGASSVALVYDGGGLRSAWAFGDRDTALFHPYADGVVKAAWTDVDDFAVIRRFLACSLTASCRPGERSP